MPGARPSAPWPTPGDGRRMRLARMIQAVDAHAAGEPGHRFRHRAAAADGMIDPVLVFEERQDREQARAAERRHPEIFGLEREGEADPRVLEVALQVLVDAAAGMEVGESGDHGRRGHGTQGVEGLFQHGLEEFQLHPVVGEELVVRTPVALDERVADEKLPAGLRVDTPVVDLPVGDDRYAVQRDLLVRHHGRLVLLPVRLAVRPLEEVLGERLHPLRFDPRVDARPEAARLHELR